jgi:membrane dipeptidase
LTVGPVGTKAPDTAFMETVRGIAFWEREIDDHPDVLSRVRTAADIAKAKKARRTGLVYGVQDGVAFETDLDRLDDLHALGLRVVQPTYNRRNLLGDGCLEPANAGLSRTGIEAIERMNKLGILVDLSHCGRQTAADAIRLSKKPVAFTHTGCQALADHPRNRTDEELRAVADKGGLSGIYFMPYLSEGRQPTAADIVRHLEHMVQVAGEDHVSIGTDGNISATTVDDEFKEAFAKNTRERREAGIAAPWETEQGYLFAADLNTPRRLATLAMMLADRRHSAARIEKILGGNLLRVFGETWKA